MKRFVFVLVLTFLFLGGRKTAFALEDAIDLTVPQFYLDGTRCPDPDSPEGLLMLEELGLDWGASGFDPRDHIFLCGSTRNVQKVYEGDKILTGNPIEGVVVAVYQSNENGKLDYPYSYNISNSQGEYIIPIKKSVVNYLTFMCPVSGSDTMLLADLYQVDTSKAPHGYNSFDIGLPCPSTTALTSVDLPTQVGYIDEDGFLECGTGQAPFTPDPNALQEVSDTFSLVKLNYDNQFAGNVVDIDNPEAGSVPSDYVVPAGVDFEGYQQTFESEDARSSSANLNFLMPGVGSNRAAKYGDTGTQLPTCSLVEENYNIIGSGTKSSRESWGLLGLALPGQLKKKFDALSNDVKKDYEFCTKEDGSPKTLADSEWGDPDFPYDALNKISNDVNLDQKLVYSEYEYYPENDSGVNDPGVGDEDVRVDFAKDDGVGKKPFYAGARSRRPNDGEVANISGELGDTSFTPLEYFKLPGDVGVENRLDSADEGFSGLTRIGIGTVLCSCSTITEGDEINVCKNPLPFFDTENTIVSPGYEIANADDGTFLGDQKEDTSFLSVVINAIFSWFSGTLEEEVGECLLEDSYDVVPYCEPSNTSCDAVRVCNEIYCDLEYRHYTYKVQGGECAGDVTAQVTVKAENKPPQGDASVDDKTLAWASLIYKIPGMQLPNIGGAGAWQNDITDSVEGQKTQLGESSVSSKHAGLYNTDLLRFSVALPQNTERADYNPPKIFPEYLPLSGQCDGQAFGKILKNGWSNPGYILQMSPVDPFNQFSTILGKIGEEQYEAYGAAEATTGVPCEILAGIHWMEGSNEVGNSLIDGLALRGNNLTEDAIYAANHFKTKSMSVVPDAGVDPTKWTIDQVIYGLSAYNGGGNQQCPWTVANNYVDPPTTGPLTAYSSCPEKFPGEDDPYATDMLSSRNLNMAIIYPADSFRADLYCAGSDVPPCPLPYETIRPGAFTIAFLVHGGFVGP